MIVLAQMPREPALWQGIMFIVLALWCGWLWFDVERNATPVRLAVSGVVLTAIGIALAVGLT